MLVCVVCCSFVFFMIFSKTRALQINGKMVHAACSWIFDEDFFDVKTFFIFIVKAASHSSCRRLLWNKSIAITLLNVVLFLQARTMLLSTLWAVEQKGVCPSSRLLQRVAHRTYLSQTWHHFTRRNCFDSLTAVRASHSVKKNKRKTPDITYSR